MSIGYRVMGFLIGYTLPPPLIPSTTYLQDLSVAIPLCICVDTVVTAGRNLLTKGSFIKPLPWSGNAPSIADPESWRSPAQTGFHSILESEAVTEGMALKLLRANTIASQPYETSDVARRLLELAVFNCWVALTEFLIGLGTPTDQRVSYAQKT